MNLFDKIKIVTNIEFISILNYSSFQCITKLDNVLYYKYQQKSPSLLLIMINYQNHELIIEFTAKILKEKYPLLINNDTIRECLENINDLGLCELNIDSILNNSQVAKCDVTKDVFTDINLVKSAISQNLSNYSKWIVKNYNNGLVLENVVSTPRYKKRLTIYDKEKELGNVSNVNFINSIENGECLIDLFKHKVRFELNINTKKQIRQLLAISNNNLLEVLQSNVNPILSVIDEAVMSECLSHRTRTLRDFERELLLQKCDYNLIKVEALVRSLINKNTSITRAMRPYKELLKLIKYESISNLDLRKLVS